MLADAFPERAAAAKADNRRRAIAAVAVGLLHAFFLLALIRAVAVHGIDKVIPRAPIEIIYLLQPPPAATDKKKQEEQHAPEIIPANREPTTAPITIAPLPPRPRSSDEDGIGKLGHYLDNCSSGNYQALSQQEWANCLGGLATRDKSGTVKLGDVRTLWEMQHPPPPPANPKQADGFVDCARNMPQRNLGLPCFQHDGQRPSVQNGQQ